MTQTDPRSERIEEKIAASQERLTRESGALPPVPRRAQLPDAYPPEDYRSLAAEYPWLVLAAGAGLGLLAGALLPRKAGSKLGGKALGLAAMAGELGLSLATQARDKAGESTAGLRDSAGRKATASRNAAASLARGAIRAASRVRTTRK